MPSIQRLLRAGCTLVVLGLTASASSADNLVVNPNFDADLSGWSNLQLSSWEAGTARVVKHVTVNDTFGPSQGCFAVTPGETIVAGGATRVPVESSAPGGLGAYWTIYQYTDTSCANYFGQEVAFHNNFPDGVWRRGITAWVVPEGVFGVELGARFEASLAVEQVAYFDEAVFEVTPPPPSDAWLSTAQLPGFRFQVRIGGSRTGALETACADETLCVSGAVPGRAEVLVRIVGPKPNGHLWPNLVKFSTSQIEVWIEQSSSGVVRYYSLAAADPNDGILEGLFDRTGFLDLHPATGKLEPSAP
jgi:hypothetical protein